ncbi:MAG TPA: hypothetical protein VF230_05545 [Acidimicrobiales bacterium]
MTTAQIVFAIPFAAIALLIVFFSLYVVSSTIWGNRWVRRSK